MNILIVGATNLELNPILAFLGANYTCVAPLFYRGKGLQIQVLVTGIGAAATAFHLGRYFAKQKPDLALQVGIGGTYRKNWVLGEAVVQVVSERWGDLGIEQGGGSFKTLFESGLEEYNDFPYINGKLYSSSSNFDFLPKAQGFTVHRCTGSEESIGKHLGKFPDIEVESMEGAAFFYACLHQEDLAFLQLRAISNYVEERNPKAWKIGESLESLVKVLGELLDILGE